MNQLQLLLCMLGSAAGACSAGFYGSASFCAKCPRGYYRGAGAPLVAGKAVCEPCAHGSYGWETGQAQCILCGAGRYSKVLAATSDRSCTRCNPGKFTPVDGSTVCIDCPTGKYAYYRDSMGCDACIPGSITTIPPKVVVSTAAEECEPCIAGQFSTASHIACEKCPSGKYNDKKYCFSSNSADNVHSNLSNANR
jgi:hypothetical protein